MKIMIFLILVNTIAFGQVEADHGLIVWRTVKQYKDSSESLLKQLKSSEKFSALELLDNTIVGKFKDLSINYKGTASMYLMASNMIGSFIIEFKENRYRITVKNLQLESQTNVGVFDQGSIESIEKYALTKNGEFRKRFESKDRPIIEDNLSKLFVLSYTDDW